MASGSFKTNVVTSAGSGYHRQIEVIWSSTNNSSNNSSTVSWSAYSRCPDSTNTARWVNAWNIYVTINNVRQQAGSGTTALKKDMLIGSGSVTVSHNSDGRKTGVAVSITASIWDSSKTNATYSGTINLDPNPVYNLTVPSVANCTISVNRTSCAGSGSTGSITTGTKNLYYGDTLKITASAASSYQLTSLTVNGNNFTSGNTHSVSGNVTISASVQALASTMSVSPTSVALGGQTVITITKYNANYQHSIAWSFAGHSGYITGTGGGTQSGESKFSGSPVTFTVPTSWGGWIPSAMSGTCTLTCTTYDSGGTNRLGTPVTKTFTVTVPNNNPNTPQITEHIVRDTNTVTLALTDNSSRLVKYMSNAECVMSASSRSGATLSSATIDGTSVMPSGATSSITQATKSYPNVTQTSFAFAVKDSRGYTVSYTANPTIVEYVNLTCVPTVSRPVGASETATLKISGSFFNGAFNAAGTKVNTLSLSYMYKENVSSEAWPTQWTTINANQITKTGSTYLTADITVGTEFDYLKSYAFRVKAEDGYGNTVLNSITKEVLLSTARPIFDWGQNTFNFNVGITFEDQQQTGPARIVFRNNMDLNNLERPHSIVIGGGSPNNDIAMFVQDAIHTTKDANNSSVFYYPFAYEDANKDILLYASSNAKARSYLADFPNEVKYDSTTGLFYRTWFSGVVEIWGRKRVTVPGVSQSGSLYFTNSDTTFTIPVTLASVSNNSIQLTSCDSLAWATNATVGGTTATFRWMRATTMTTGAEFNWNVHIIGRTGNYVDRYYHGDQEPSRAGAVVVTDEIDAGGGIIKHISAVDLSNDTVDAAHLLQGYTAHDKNGNAITGTYT